LNLRNRDRVRKTISTKILYRVVVEKIVTSKKEEGSPERIFTNKQLLFIAIPWRNLNNAIASLATEYSS